MNYSDAQKGTAFFGKFVTGFYKRGHQSVCSFRAHFCSSLVQLKSLEASASSHDENDRPPS